MKNIHIIATEKPSRLGYLTKKGKEVFNDLRLFDRLMPNILDSQNQNLYITSDEEIKIDDYFIESLGLPDSYLVHKLSKEWKDKESFYRRCTKVILTTDQDLIKDGVQAIDDEFLQWFVKNPSCEQVEVEKVPYDGTKSIDKYWGGEYKIIIPKEEPKQETLEEAIKREYETRKFNSDFPFDPQSFKLGAKWQAERMYSEEEVRLAYFQGEKDSYIKGGQTKEMENEFIESLKQKHKLIKSE